ncbi:hypothetical protein CSC02_0776 [Enterobacter hormaechei subsp. hoffmannii]|nr:hypothetical protein CSC02_0776 [Enterobacter hormaechei subsp. hoffmannii]
MEYTVSGALCPIRIRVFVMRIACDVSQDMISFQQIAKKLIF